MAADRFLVTGGTGCIGSWVVRGLVRAGIPVTVLASSGRMDRLELVLSPDELASVEIVRGDITDVPALEAATRASGAAGIIHLAALQMPFCAADPIRGARVNVEGTAAVFELARRLEIGHIVYASSAAAYGPAAFYADEVVGADAPLHPTSFYGVVQDGQRAGGGRVPHSVGHLVHRHPPPLRLRSGPRPGRHVQANGGDDRGGGRAPIPHRLRWRLPVPVRGGCRGGVHLGGRAPARWRAGVQLPGPRIAVASIVELLGDLVPSSRGRITHGDRVLPFPAAFDGAPIEDALGPLPLTPVEEGVQRTLDTYRAAFSRGLLDDAWLDRVTGA